MDIDQLIITLVEAGRQASEEELDRIIEHVARAPFATHPVRISRWLREELRKHQLHVTQARMPSLELHLLSEFTSIDSGHLKRPLRGLWRIYTRLSGILM